MRLQRIPLAALVDRAWQLRDNVTFYDALYVALAEEAGAPLLTLTPAWEGEGPADRGRADRLALGLRLRFLRLVLLGRGVEALGGELLARRLHSLTSMKTSSP